MKRAEIARQRFEQGFSCSQAVFSALAERWNVDPELALRVAAGFGGGLARSAQTCGCVSGAIMALGMAQSTVAPGENRAAKEATYEAGQRFLRTFTGRNGSTLCADLLGCNISTPAGLTEAREQGLFRARCGRLVEDAVEIVEEMLDGAEQVPHR